MSSCRIGGDDCRSYSIKSVSVERVAGIASVNDVIAARVDRQTHEGVDEPFYVVDLNDIVKKYEQWTRLLPRVTPFYAVKCLSEPGVIELLVRLGLSFDCASKNEIQLIKAAGVEPDRIIFANTIKSRDMLRFASKSGVDLMTFDNEEELLKIKSTYPEARLVLRILPPKAKKVITQLGHKFGCPLTNVRTLLARARKLELNVVGVSFHVGFGCTDAIAFERAVEAAAAVFLTAKEEGYNLELLDIGGGFPGTPFSGITMEQVVDLLAPALDKHFPVERGVRIIAEPGAFFVGSALHLVTQVIGRRVGTIEDPAKRKGFRSTRMIEYYLNDGNYGSFGRGLEPHRWRAPVPLHGGGGLDQFPGSENKLVNGGGRCENGGGSSSSSSSSSSNGRSCSSSSSNGSSSSSNGSRSSNSSSSSNGSSSSSNGSGEEYADDVGDEHFYSVLYGPTCDGVDEIVRGVAMPEYGVGDWLVFPYMGQYTISGACEFNGMPRPHIYYVQMLHFDSKFLT